MVNFVFSRNRLVMLKNAFIKIVWRQLIKIRIRNSVNYISNNNTTFLTYLQSFYTICKEENNLFRIEIFSSLFKNVWAYPNMLFTPPLNKLPFKFLTLFTYLIIR